MEDNTGSVRSILDGKMKDTANCIQIQHQEPVTLTSLQLLAYISLKVAKARIFPKEDKGRGGGLGFFGLHTSHERILVSRFLSSLWPPLKAGWEVVRRPKTPGLSLRSNM